MSAKDLTPGLENVPGLQAVTPWGIGMSSALTCFELLDEGLAEMGAKKCRHLQLFERSSNNPVVKDLMPQMLVSSYAERTETHENLHS